jgi:hypothetical protein
MFDEVIADLAPCGSGTRAAAVSLSAHVLQTHVLQIDSFILRDAVKRPLLRMRSPNSQGEERGTQAGLRSPRKLGYDACLDPCGPLDA